MIKFKWFVIFALIYLVGTALGIEVQHLTPLFLGAVIGFISTDFSELSARITNLERKHASDGIGSES